MIYEIDRTNLFVSNGEGWANIPGWMNFYVNIGKNFFENIDKKGKTRLAMTLPTRSYAGVSIAFGAILSSISNRVDERTVNEHFKMIKGLDVGTSVIYRKQNRIFRGVYSGTEIVGGGERVRITVQEEKAGSLTEILNPKQSLYVQVELDKNYKLPKNPKGKENKVSNFLKAGFQDYDINRLLTVSEIQFYYIGNKKWVKEEAIDTNFAVFDSKNDEYILGNLHELLRFKEFMGEKDAYKSLLLSSRTVNHKFDLKNTTASTITIFDGAMSYLRWRNEFKHTNCIIILDRTEPQFENALIELSDEYILDQKVTKDFSLDAMSVPNGVEIMLWEVYQ